MAKVGLTRAAELTGKSPSTIHRAMRKGRVSFEVDDHGARLVDVAELERAFGLRAPAAPDGNGATPLQRDGMAVVELRAQLELARMRAAMLEERMRDIALQRDEIREDRDRWRVQAERLLTDQRDRSEPGRRSPPRWRRLLGLS
jgi:hypothetical protein